MTVATTCNTLHKAILRTIAPALRHPQHIYVDLLKLHVTPRERWLDVGCGHSILPTWRRSYLEEEHRLVDNCRCVVGLDYDHSSLVQHQTIRCKARGDIAALPFAANSFDLVTANMVVEHLHNPEKQFREIYRVLKPGGRFIFHTPNACGYYVLMARLIPECIKPKFVSLVDTRLEQDIFRTFYRANSPAKIQELAVKTDFEIAEIKMIVSSGEAMLMLIPPLDMLQLLWIKLLMTRALRLLRTNIIAILQKPERILPS